MWTDIVDFVDFPKENPFFFSLSDLSIQFNSVITLRTWFTMFTSSTQQENGKRRGGGRREEEEEDLK
jgi:hypothetical protein